MILEGLVTSRDADGAPNVAPQGPIVAADFSQLIFRPFPPSKTYFNLKSSRCGVFHVVDDVQLLVRTALDLPGPPPPMFPARTIAGDVLAECCRWFEFRVEEIDEQGERPRFISRVVHAERLRDFWGFNRARHAVIEATIAATRIALLGAENVREELERLRSPIEKTGGPAEREAFALVVDFVRRRSASP